MIKIAIIGASGYSGAELLKLLISHPQVEIKKLFGLSTVGINISSVHKSLRGIIDLNVEQFDEANLAEIDLVFVALPSGESMKIVPKLIEKGKRVIDLGGDFRLNDLNDFSKYYKHEHTAQNLLEKSVYGLSEWNEKEISNAKLIANPGCYPTSIQLALLPLVKNKIINENFISITSYSGTSGAGKSATQSMIFSEVNESVRAYKISTHQHIPEIKQYLKYFSGVETNFTFVPHLLPVTRGIYTTITTTLKNGIETNLINEIFEKEYSQKPFIRLLKNEIPELKDVVYSNYCDISWNIDENKNLVLISTIDNLIKGAAGQAVQNMNIMFGLDQTTGFLNVQRRNGN